MVHTQLHTPREAHIHKCNPNKTKQKNKMLEKQAHICSLLVSRASPRKGEEESLCRAGCLLGFFFVGQFQIFVGAFICSKLNEVFFFSVPWQTLV